MPKPAGFTAYTNSTEITHDNGGAEIPAGSAVTTDDNGVVSEADGDAGDELTGITGDDPNSAEKERVVVDGVVIARVATGTPAGVDVGVGNATNGTVGVLEETADGPAHTLSAEGGEFQGFTLDDGLAAVKVE